MISKASRRPATFMFICLERRRPRKSLLPRDGYQNLYVLDAPASEAGSRFRRLRDGLMRTTLGSDRVDKLVPVSRFLIRQGSRGWFVYDRERKGPALVGTDLAVKLTKERADEIQRKLTAEFEQKALRFGSAD